MIGGFDCSSPMVLFSKHVLCFIFLVGEQAKDLAQIGLAGLGELERSTLAAECVSSWG